MDNSGYKSSECSSTAGQTSDCPVLGSVLSRITDVKDIKSLSSEDLLVLAREIREIILSTVSKNGGHLSSNLGVVELTIALHRVFSSPDDKIVWDVGHQCYAHKILTGRLKNFATLRKSGGVSGFPRTAESVHDAFNCGHASTSVSVALGFLAKEMLCKTENRHHSVAVMGDGALTGGLAYEALSHAGHLGWPLIVILNDNRMSISRNVGGISQYLSRLSMKPYYQSFRRNFDSMIKRVPVVGNILFKAIIRMKRAVKAVFYPDNFFVDLGFEYVGPIEGHDLERLQKVLYDVYNLNRPVVVHVVTKKGKGYPPAEENPSAYHSVAPFPLEIFDSPEKNTDSPAKNASANAGEPTWTKIFSEALVEAGRKYDNLVAVTAAMETGTGLSAFKREFPARFFDTGIAEEHAVTFSAALAASGLKPVTSIYSTFMQRSYDELIHDAALQNLPVVFVLDRAGFVADDGETHQGLFDISMFLSVPNITIMCPANGAELKMMLDFALNCSSPCMIRYPKGRTSASPHTFLQALSAGRGVFEDDPQDAKAAAENFPDAGICLAFTGSLYPQASSAASILCEKGKKACLYNLRFLKPLDEDYLCSILNVYDVVAVIEEGIKNGGFGEYVSELASRKSCSAKIVCLNAGSKFYPQGSREELLKQSGLDATGIANAVLELSE